MTGLTTTTATAWALALMLGAGITGWSQGAQGQQHGQPMQQMPGQQGMPMQPGQMPGMMGQGAMGHMGPHMMSPDQMREMMEHMAGMMGQGMMQPGMMGQGMMQPGTLSQGSGGWTGLEGRRVVPMVQLSTDDVRGFFERHLAALGNERLKVGTVEALDEDTITAEIVTVDDSLVESFAVDRHTGMISSAG